MDELMCWLGVGEDGIQIRCYEPVTSHFGGVTWAYVTQDFAEEALRVWKRAIYGSEMAAWR